MDAIHKLAVGEGDVRHRLRYAIKEINRLRESDVPPSLRKDWGWVIAQVTKFGGDVDVDGEVYQNAADHTLSRIRNSTGRRIAERIYRINSSLQDDECLKHLL